MRDTTTIVITVTATVTRPGAFTASFAGAALVTSREPLLAAARELIHRGADPGTRLIMRWAGAADTDALISTVGVAAQLTVDEDGPKFRRWRGPQTRDQGPLVRFGGAGGAAP